MTEATKRACILIVDDEIANMNFLEVVLQQAGYNHVQSTTDAREALPCFTALQPDSVPLDLNMLHFDGFEVMQQLQGQVPQDSFLPILVLTADTRSQTKHRALEQGPMISRPSRWILSKYSCARRIY
jgi:CheY-like chemotaxis protein